MIRMTEVLQIDDSWLEVIDENILKKMICTIDRICISQKICPDRSVIFKAFRMFSLDSLKAVFLGQDPYPQKDVATGILFGNRENTPVSPSLQVIKDSIKDLENSNNDIIFDSSLESWARQGILMINSAFTTEQNRTGSHIMLWRPFVSELIKNISDKKDKVLFVLFGRQAQTFRPYIDENRHKVIVMEHPAYFARTKEKMPCKIFMDINSCLIEQNRSPIEWYKLK